MSKTTPGLKRLRANPAAEAIRTKTLADQKRAKGEARAKIAAATAASESLAEAPALVEAPKPTAEAAKAASEAAKALGKRAALMASAEAGVMPSAPDFSAKTHTRFRGKLAEVVALVEAGDVDALAAYEYQGFLSSSPKAILKYRDLAVVALESRAARAVAA
jgi:hypothetical protein